MAYRNKTYVIFDGDKDMWAYAYMKGWKKNENVEFDFFDAHDIRPLSDSATEESVKRALRERMNNAKQVIVLVGESTKNLFKFVRWEIELAINKDLPIVIVNLNDSKNMDNDRCPPILKDHWAVHVPFKLAAIRFALDDLPDHFAWYKSNHFSNIIYKDEIYKKLGI